MMFDMKPATTIPLTFFIAALLSISLLRAQNPPAAPSSDEVNEVYAKLCSGCHGADARVEPFVRERPVLVAGAGEEPVEGVLLVRDEAVERRRGVVLRQAQEGVPSVSAARTSLRL